MTAVHCVPRRSRGVRTVLAGLALVLVAASCSSGLADRIDLQATGGGEGAEGTEKSQAAPAPPAIVTVSPTNRTGDVAPSTPVVVTATDGTLSSVTVTNAAGGPVAGAFDEARAMWRSTAPLDFGATYNVSAVATNPDGEETAQDAAFSTAAPVGLAYDAITPLAGQTVGVGLPIRIWFNDDATDSRLSVANKEEVVKHLNLTVTPPQEGAWRWFANDTELHYRPKEYWQAGSQVTLDVNLYGVELADGVYFKRSRQVAFSIGAKHVSIADVNTHRLKVYDGDRLVQDFPTSMGRGGDFHTMNGVHVVMVKNRFKTMDSTTFGLALDAGGYVTEVEYATRISNSGEFVHSAPWSVADQGVRNVSHGCINLSPERAAWFFNFSQVGDLVEVVGSPEPFTVADGAIYDWTIPWEQWIQPS